jgi:hypothetical protein
LEPAAVVVLVSEQGLAGSGGHQGRVGGQDAQQHLALGGLGAGQREADRQALAGADQVQPQPPNQREWLAQEPYGAQPASADRLVVSRERPHATGVESATPTSAVQNVVGLASARMTCRMSSAAARRRWLAPGCLGS